MVKSILEIGNAKYTIDTNVLRRFFQEAQQSTCMQAGQDAVSFQSSTGGGTFTFQGGESVHEVFTEVMRLYNEYSTSGDLAVLIELKCKLEEVSLRYKSLTLAEEVLIINSCLPYEWRVRRCGCQDDPDFC